MATPKASDVGATDVEMTHAQEEPRVQVDAVVEVDSAEAEAEIDGQEAESGENDYDMKLILLNFGKWKDSKSMDEFLRGHQIKFRKIQKARQLTFGFVIFDSQEERDAAKPLLEKLEWCGELLEVKSALAKRSLKGAAVPRKKRDRPTEDAPAAENQDEAPAVAGDASDVVTPWANVPYEEQLERKEAEMKKVLVKIVRQTRKEYMKKEKRIAQEEKRHAKKQKKENGAAADATSASRHPAVPEWLTSHGSVYVVADDVLYARNHEAAADAWTRVADAANVVAIVSFGSDLVAALADQTVCALNQENGAGTWNKICDGPGKPIKSLAGLRGSLLCCTEEGKVMKQEGAGRFASGKWQQIGEVDGAEVITVHSGFVFAYAPTNATSKWWRAPLGADALEKLEFEACAIEVEAIGATSHDATLIVLTKDSLAYVSNDNAIVKTVPLGLPQAAQKLTAFASHKGLCCPMDSIHRSPVTEGYRNKCEFSIGYDENGKPCIGFRLGLYRDGSIVVSRPDQCVNVSTVMKNVCDAVQALIEKSGAPVYDLKAHAGFWRLLTVRHSERTNDLMIMLVVKPDDIKVAQYEALKKQIIEHLTDSALPFKVSSLYVQEYSGVSTASEKDPTILIHGKPTIEEILLDMRFSVSPHAFFQVNTEGAEALYSLVRSHAKANESTLLYDVCCGTGTIGICASKGVGKVVGIEICKSATDNAAENAKLNNVKNVSFINSKAEDVMKDLLKAKLSDDEAHLQNVVAIVDPPRAGLHNQVLRSLRGCPPVKRIVYVSCNPTGSLIQDATMLCGPKTKSINGEPFHPAYGVPVDMFPHTPHCEMIVVFERD